MTLQQFTRRFSSDDVCLRYLWQLRYAPDGEHADCPKCKRERAFKRYATKQGRQSWTCTGCGHHVHPTAGTIFHKSSTSLCLWFQAMFLVANEPSVSAKCLERELKVDYATARRMKALIREAAA